MEADETVQYYISTNIAIRDSMHVRYDSVAAIHYLPTALTVSHSFHTLNVIFFNHLWCTRSSLSKWTLTWHCSDFDMPALVVAEMHSSTAKINVGFVIIAVNPRFTTILIFCFVIIEQFQIMLSFLNQMFLLLIFQEFQNYWICGCSQSSRYLQLKSSKHYLLLFQDYFLFLAQ